MSAVFIHNLGISRLREIGSMLKIPRYSTFKNPNELRLHIEQYLDEQGQVKPDQLRAAGLTAEQFNARTREMRQIVARRLGLTVSQLGQMKYHSQKNQLDDELYRSLKRLHGAKLTRALSAEVIRDIKKVASKDAPGHLKELIKEMELTHKANEEKYRDEKKHLENEKINAIKNLESMQETVRELTKKVDELQAKLQVSDEDHAKHAKIIQEKTAEIAKLQQEIEQKKKELITAHSVIEALQLKAESIGLQGTKFSEALQETFAKYDKTIAELNEIIITNTHECDAKVQNALDTLKSCTDREESLKTQLIQLDETSRKCEERARQAEEALSSMSKGDAKKVQAEISELRDQYKKCLEGSVQIRKDYDEINAKYTSDKEKTAEFAQKVEKVQELLSKTEDKLQTTSDALTQCGVDKFALTEQLHEKNSRIAELEDYYERCRKQVQPIDAAKLRRLYEEEKEQPKLLPPTWRERGWGLLGYKPEPRYAGDTMTLREHQAEDQKFYDAMQAMNVREQPPSDKHPAHDERMQELVEQSEAYDPELAALIPEGPYGPSGPHGYHSRPGYYVKPGSCSPSGPYGPSGPSGRKRHSCHCGPNCKCGPHCKCGPRCRCGH